MIGVIGGYAKFILITSRPAPSMENRNRTLATNIATDFVLASMAIMENDSFVGECEWCGGEPIVESEVVMIGAIGLSAAK